MKIQMGAVLCIALTLPACASVTRGTKTAWEVTSTPSGARVATSNGYQCAATPCAIKMPRRSEFVATLSRPGYEDATVTVTNKVATGGGVAMAGNVLVGGLIGAGIDASSGAMLDLTPNPAHVDMTPVAQRQVRSGADFMAEQDRNNNEGDTASPHENEAPQ